MTLQVRDGAIGFDNSGRGSTAVFTGLDDKQGPIHRLSIRSSLDSPALKNRSTVPKAPVAIWLSANMKRHTRSATGSVSTVFTADIFSTMPAKSCSAYASHVW